MYTYRINFAKLKDWLHFIFNMIGNNLENRFYIFKKNFEERIYGLQWEQDKKNFDIEFINGEFKNLGKWNFLPSIYKNQFKNYQFRI